MFKALRAAHASLAHATRDHRRVARHAAARSDDRLRRNHAMKVIRTGFLTHEHDRRSFARHLFRFVGTEHNLALRSARARRQTRRQHGRVGLWDRLSGAAADRAVRA